MPRPSVFGPPQEFPLSDDSRFIRSAYLRPDDVWARFRRELSVAETSSEVRSVYNWAKKRFEYLRRTGSISKDSEDNWLQAMDTIVENWLINYEEHEGHVPTWAEAIVAAAAQKGGSE